jgi:hypothetical protein
MYLYNNTPSNAIVHVASNISYRSLIQADFFFSSLYERYELQTNVVIGKLDQLVHKQNCYHDFLFYFRNYNIIIV